MTLALLEHEVSTPIGSLLLIVDGAGALRAAEWADGRERLPRLLRQHYGSGAFTLTASATSPEFHDAFQAYFAGHTRALDELRIKTGGTAFQARVWQALRTIPPGRPLSYHSFGLRLGLPRHARAIGHANAANPLNIIVPCHRLVGGSGHLTGYAGGLDRKRWLLEHEAAHAHGDGLP